MRLLQSGEQVPADVKIHLPKIYRARGFRDLTSGLFSYAFTPMIDPNDPSRNPEIQ